MAPATARRLSRVGGTNQPMWRSLDEVADTPEFRDFLEREFPAGASELLSNSRRDFMKVMGAGLALAGAATIPGCRRPDHKILAYSATVPEEVIPGKPLYYATSMPLPGGYAEGLLVETHEGRPTKIEGNPLHPLNRGKSSVWAQTSVLGLYDPDRLKHPVFTEPGKDPKTATWADFQYWWNEVEKLGDRFDSNGGDGLAFVIGRTTSPTVEHMRRRIKDRWPNAVWAVYEPAEVGNAALGLKQAVGQPVLEMVRFADADVVFSLDRDFLNTASGREPNAMTYAREFAAKRAPMNPGDPMNRLYMVESNFSLTGAQADHRLALAPSHIQASAVKLARAVLTELGTGGQTGALRSALDAIETPEALDDEFFTVAARDLVEHRGRCVIVAGESLPPEYHALVVALNQALNAAVGYRPVDARLEGERTDSPVAGIRAVANLMDGRLNTLVCLGTNPVYDAPPELNFGANFAKVPNTITLSVNLTETAVASKWQLNGQHALESWGDTVAADGTVAPIQPMIAPLYEPAQSSVEFLAWLIGDDAWTEEVVDPAYEQYGSTNGSTNGSANGSDTNGAVPTVRRVSGYLVVRDTWQRLGMLSGDFEKGWRRALHDGVVPAGRQQRVAPARATEAATNAFRQYRLPAGPSDSAFDVVFDVGFVADGRYANDSWLQELPATATRTVWENPALMSPATAERLGVMPEPYTKRQLPRARIASVSLNGRSLDMPVWIVPGMADNTVILTLGYGRTASGVVGNGVGTNTYELRDAASRMVAFGATVSRTTSKKFVASTQNHWSLEGRDTIVRQIDLPYFKQYASDKVEKQKDKIYGGFEQRIHLAEQMGELSHTPKNVSIYDNPYNNGPHDPDEDERVKDRLGIERPPEYAIGPQWGMSIDMSSCTGCGVCTIACQSENNIPAVGPNEVAKGREMQWIRVDRYFTGEDPFSPDEMVHQPVACVQCENAPCETVCPVNATVHGPEGLNLMVYNRCIGTRYCSNNCPYKVRRFNFFDWGQTKFNGSFVGEDVIGRPGNVNFIPPRLRERVDEISKMKHNPDVTIRSRGVMEKCTYCLQRINRARYETKLHDLEGIPDGFFQVACQQACPSNAIRFGDILDDASRVSEARNNHRSYLLLGYLNTRPRTTHMLRVRNPHPDLRAPVDPLAGHHGGGHGEGDHHDGEHHGEETHGFLHDPRKKLEDPGYAGSLRVLGSALGVHA